MIENFEELNKLCANDSKPDSMVEKYRGINVIAKDVGSKLHLVDTCPNCVFKSKDCINVPCLPSERADKRDIYFVEVQPQ